MQARFNTVHLVRSVDLFTLKLFLAVVEEGQVSRAAARENIAASSITKRIQELEDIVGASLFERTARGLVTLPAGAVLARHVARIFATVEDMRRDFSEFTAGVRGQVRVCSAGGLIGLYIGAEIAEFARDFPLVDIDLKEAVNPDVIRDVATGAVDVGIFVRVAGSVHDDIEMVPYRTDRLLAVVGRDHPLAEREHVKALELLKHNYIGVAPSSTVVEYMRRTAASAGVEYKPKYSVSTVQAAAGLVRVNNGVTIMPENTLSAPELEWARTVPLDEPWATRHIVAGVPKGRELTVAARNFLQRLTARARKP